MTSLDFSVTLFIRGVVEAVFYGGLLWAAGTIIGQLDAIKKRLPL